MSLSNPPSPLFRHTGLLQNTPTDVHALLAIRWEDHVARKFMKRYSRRRLIGEFFLSDMQDLQFIENVEIFKQIHCDSLLLRIHQVLLVCDSARPWQLLAAKTKCLRSLCA